MEIKPLLIAAALLINACGDAEYVAYKSPEEGGTENQETGEATTEQTDGVLTCPDSAVAVFGVSVAPALNSACTNCHKEGQHPFPFYPGQDARNRDILLGWNGLDANKLAEFISSSPPHEGGDQSASLPASKITQWIAAENDCASGG